MPNKKSPRKKGKEESESSQSEGEQTVEDKQQLLQGATAGSGEIFPRIDYKKYNENTRLGKRSPSRSVGGSKSGDAPPFGRMSESDSLEQGSGASPSKRSRFKMKNPLIKREKSPKHSSDSERSCTDVKRYPECIESTSRPADSKRHLEGKSTETSSGESKQSSSTASPVISKKTVANTQSSSSSYASAAEYSRTSSEPDRGFLTVPNPESSPVSPKKSPIKKIFNLISPRKKSPNRSPEGNCSCRDKQNHESNCPESKPRQTGARPKTRKAPSPNRTQAKSETSSSSNSPLILKRNVMKKDSDASILSSDVSFRLCSKSSSYSDQSAAGSSAENKKSGKSESDTAPRMAQSYGHQDATYKLSAHSYCGESSSFAASGPSGENMDEGQQRLSPIERCRTQSANARFQGLSINTDGSSFGRNRSDSAGNSSKLEKSPNRLSAEVERRRISGDRLSAEVERRRISGDSEESGSSDTQRRERLPECRIICGKRASKYEHKTGCPKFNCVRRNIRRRKMNKQSDKSRKPDKPDKPDKSDKP